MEQSVTITASLADIRAMIHDEIHTALATHPDRLLTAKEAKAECGISNHKTFLSLGLPVVMVKTRRYYSLNSIKKWKQSCTRSPW